MWLLKRQTPLSAKTSFFLNPPNFSAKKCFFSLFCKPNRSFLSFKLSQNSFFEVFACAYLMLYIEKKPRKAGSKKRDYFCARFQICGISFFLPRTATFDETSVLYLWRNCIGAGSFCIFISFLFFSLRLCLHLKNKTKPQLT